MWMRSKAVEGFDEAKRELSELAELSPVIILSLTQNWPSDR